MLMPTSGESNSISFDLMLSNTVSGLPTETALTIEVSKGGYMPTQVNFTFVYSHNLTDGDMIYVRLPDFTGTSFSATPINMLSFFRKGSNNASVANITNASVSWSNTTHLLEIKLTGGNVLAGSVVSVSLSSSIGLATPSVWPPPTPYNHINSGSEQDRFSLWVLADAASTIQMSFPFLALPVEVDHTFGEPVPRSTTWAHLVPGPAEDYLKQDTFNGSTWNSTLQLISGTVVRPPPRYGHSLSVTTTNFSGRAIRNEVYLFGGRYNGVRKHLWKYRPGVYNTEERIVTLRDASQDTLSDEARLCAKTKQSSAYSHVCNTWQPANASILRGACGADTDTDTPEASTLQVDFVQYLLVVQGSLCVGVATGTLSPASEPALVVQRCTSDITQRFSLRMNDSSIRLYAELDEFGRRVGGGCVTARMDSMGVYLSRCHEGKQLMHTQSIVQYPGTHASQVQFRFPSTDMCLAVSHVSNGLDMLRTPLVHSSLAGASLVQRSCNVQGPSYSSVTQFHTNFVLRIATNTCSKAKHRYDVNGPTGSGSNHNGRHLGRFDHAMDVFSPSRNALDVINKRFGSSGMSSGEYGKLVTVGGQDLQTGFLGDVWIFSIRNSCWEQVFDGHSWQVPRDAHLYSKEIIRLALASASLHGDLVPSPRSGHTVVALFQEQTASVTKPVWIFAAQFVRTRLEYQQVRFKAGQHLDKNVFPDDDGSVYKSARTRDFGMYRVAKSHGWNGTSYPYQFKLNSAEFSQSLVNGYTVTLLSYQSVQLVRDVEVVVTSNEVISDDQFRWTNISSVSTYERVLVYTCTWLTTDIVAKMYNSDDSSPTSCDDKSDWSNEYESYNVTEIKKRNVTAHTRVFGKSSILMYGGWSVPAGNPRSDHGEPSDEIWVFEHNAPLSSTILDAYTPDIHDSPYNVFPCCGTSQTCCGSSNFFFQTCAQRRASLKSKGACRVVQGVDCCGSLPVMNTWKRLPQAGYSRSPIRRSHVATHSCDMLGNLVPKGRHKHTANAMGLSSIFSRRLSSLPSGSTTYRMVMFGGISRGKTFGDTWELSFDKMPTSDAIATVEIKCAAVTGTFSLQFSPDHVSPPISASADTTSLRSALEGVPGMSVVRILIVRAGLHEQRNDRLCSDFTTPCEVNNSVNTCACNCTVNNPNYYSLGALVNCSHMCLQSGCISVNSSMQGVTNTNKTRTEATICGHGHMTTTTIHLRARGHLEGSRIALSPVKIHWPTSTIAGGTTQVSAGFLALRNLKRWAFEATQYVWNYASQFAKYGPSPRSDHSCSVYQDNFEVDNLDSSGFPNGRERLVLYGGWNGSNVLNDVWIYSPSLQWGGYGVWINLATNPGKFLSVWPNFVLSAVDIFGYGVKSDGEASMPRRYQHATVSISTGFTFKDQTTLLAPRETLLVYGGIGESGVVSGDDWDIYGRPWGGQNPDFFALCLAFRFDKYCDQARSLYV
jgi:hypothetical protein